MPGTGIADILPSDILQNNEDKLAPQKLILPNFIEIVIISIKILACGL